MRTGDELLARWLEGELSGEEQAELVRLLESDPALLGRLGGQTLVDALLAVASEDEFSAARRQENIMAAVKRADQDEFLAAVEGKLRRGDRRRSFVMLAATAAVVMLSLGLWWLRPAPVATVVRVGSIDAASGIHEGMKIKAGDRLSLGSGLVELEMAGRGKMVIEGPAEVAWQGPMNASLERGRLLMRVTPQGHGYQVQTPGGKVIDLGTEFGISVDGASGMVETHVLDGEIQTVIGSQAPINLRKNDALRFGGGEQEHIPADPGSFYSSLPPLTAEMPEMVHWTMDLVDGGIARASSRGFGGGSFDFVSMTMDQGAAPQPIDGRIGGAVAFDGKGSFMESGFRGIGGRNPRTVCFWAKVPADLAPRESFGMISWGRYKDGTAGSVWQISVNPLAEDGPVGRLRVGADGGTAVGSRDLRDGEWHHIAVVLYPVSSPNVGKHVLLYIDGHLDPLSSRTFGAVETDIEQADHGVWLGRNITYVVSQPNHVHGGFFRGGMDEVYIFGGALSESQVRSLMDDRLPW
ncbi:LamG-like jellyroll fold domain-containing protein [Luteolibacter marinus]|uniref:LamG-like jellyroll fold domain-containing protein n=1 Tax=Luteolibacter marinus TaxID=2776705 RepID=UPI0018684B38|nr:LamG-like jellyroll fold domain-containing protein [Luteolibacter marinus]